MCEFEGEYVGCEAERQLCNEDDPMPFMKAEIQRVDLSESEEQHEEDKPRENGSQRKEVFVTKSTDEHREPESVAVKKLFQYKENKPK